MIELRVKECCKAHNILMSELATKMGYIQVTSLNQLLRRRKIGLDKIEQMADIIGCKVSDLFEEKEEKGDFAAFVRCRGKHFSADNYEDFKQIFEQISDMQ